jgi:hypothetical protein
MATSTADFKITGLVAGVDLSAAQYYAVKFASTAGAVIKVAGINGTGVGILQNDPTAGQACLNAGPGDEAKAVPGTTGIAAGELLGYDTSGRVVDHTTDNRKLIAQALEASSAAGDIITVLVLGDSRY